MVKSKFKFNDERGDFVLFGEVLDHVRLSNFAETTATFSDPEAGFEGLNFRKNKVNRHSIRKIETIERLTGVVEEVARIREKLRSTPVAHILDDYKKIEQSLPTDQRCLRL